MTHDASNEHPATTRRALLTQAAGGFALATSGLYLPAEVDEAEAKRPATRLGDRSQTRNRKQRNRRKKNDNHKHKNEKGNNGKGASQSRDGIRFRVYNALDMGFQVKFYAWRGTDATDYELVDDQQIPAAPWSDSNKAVFEDDAVEGFLFIDIFRSYHIDVLNPVFSVTSRLGLGGTIDDRGNWVGGQVKRETDAMLIGRTISFEDTWNVVLRRDLDVPFNMPDKKNFTVWIGSGTGPFEPDNTPDPS